ncbi:MAG: SH3 domain-containing protein [Coriobacteriales bacterium]|nr:SH3 domain-containing protein [Coriobacteriales bacterium]
MPFCPYCRYEIDEGTKFCVNCGRDVSDTNQGIQNNSSNDVGPIYGVSPADTAPIPIVSGGNTQGETLEESALNNDPKKRSRLVPILIILLIALVIIAGTIIAVIMINSNNKQDTVTIETNSSKPVEYTTYYVVNCKESITLREKPDVDSSEICQIPFGESVSVISTAENGFYEVSYLGKNGYALASYLSLDKQSKPKEDLPSKDTTYSTMYVVNCKESITLRTSPSTNASEICQIPLGACVSYVENASNGFYKVIYLGDTGYALASYLSSVYTGGSKNYSSLTYKVVNCQEWISLRSSPNTSASTICTIPLGSYVTYISNSSNGFYYIKYYGHYGYSLSEYLTPA